MCTRCPSVESSPGVVADRDHLRYLGSRWSTAYYKIIGVTDLIAADEDDYVRIAVRMATDRTAREDVLARIRGQLHLLYYRHEAVEAWASLLQGIAPGRTACAERQSSTFECEFLDEC